jgi:flagellar basal body-associated protein FliL
MSAIAIHVHEVHRRPAASEGRTLKALLIVAALMLLLAGGGSALLLKSVVRPHAAGGSQTTGPAPNYAPLPPMTFTLSSGTRLREVSVSVALEIEPTVRAEDVIPFGPRIADAMNTRMMDVAPEELSGAAGWSYVKDMVAEVANRELRSLKMRPVPANRVLVQDLLVR